jgi:hypothetical protein
MKMLLTLWRGHNQGSLALVLEQEGTSLHSNSIKRGHPDVGF